jgi:type II secretory pathway pseudopilin PulG
MKRQRLSTHHIIHNSWGFTLFEIFLALLILAIAIIPMVNAFAPALLSSGQEEEQTVLTGKARSAMNRLLDLDFRNLDTNQGNPANLVNLLYYKKPGQTEAEAMAEAEAEAAKENLIYQGQTYVPVLAITDASSGAGGLLELTVTLKTVKLQTLKAAR